MFTITQLAGHRALVQGTDTFGNVGKTVIDSTEWDSIKEHVGQHGAADAYEEALADFFAPLNNALAEIEDAAKPVVDDLFQVVIQEGSEGVAPQAAEVATLSHESAILRIIESDATGARLVWVTEDQLEIVAVSDSVTSVASDRPVDLDPETITGITEDQLDIVAASDSVTSVASDRPVDLDPETITGIAEALAANLGVNPEDIHYIGGTTTDHTIQAGEGQ